MSEQLPENIIVVVGDSPEQVVTRALAACQCSEPENHRLYAQQMLAQVLPNDGNPDWPYVLVMPDLGTDGFDYEAEGIHVYSNAEGEQVH